MKPEIVSFIPISVFMEKRLRVVFKGLGEKELDLRVGECLKFLYLCSKYGEGFIPLTKEVDEVWHELILQTEDYARLCSSLPSKRFIHHKSMSLQEYSEKLDKRGVVQRMVQWLVMYHKHFGPMNKEQAQLWTLAQFLMDELGMTLKEVNEMAACSERS